MDGRYVVATVSDGAGSASMAGYGAYIVCSEFNRQADRYLRNGGTLDAVSNDVVADWLDAVRERIIVSANAGGHRPRDYAATLVAILVGGDRSVVIHVGDGAAVVRFADDQSWMVPSWPFHGTFANTTNFVTDDPGPEIDICQLDRPIDRFALFSDGLEYHVLDFVNRSVPVYFFEQMTQAVVGWDGAGRARELSKPLRAYLDSDKICKVTDDDKSLILAAL